MSGLTIEQALEYLRSEQQVLAFSDEFLGRADLRGAVFQAILDAQGATYLEEDNVQLYKESLIPWVTEGGPNEYLPVRSHIAGAQTLVYECAVQRELLFDLSSLIQYHE